MTDERETGVYGADEGHKTFVENRLRQAGDRIAPGVIAQGSAADDKLSE